MHRFASLATAARAAAATVSVSTRGPALAAAFALSASLAGCWTDGPIPSEEEDVLEVLIGSSQPGSGRLATEFDFGIPILVEFNTELGGFTVYSGTDPGFVSLGPLVQTGPPFGLPTDTSIGIRIEAIDPGVQITFGDTVLAFEGDTVEIGTSPFDIHPDWQLIYPTGEVPPPHFVSFVLTTTAEEYTESEVYTATIVVADEE
jgi:hypothetical protein